MARDSYQDLQKMQPTGEKVKRQWRALKGLYFVMSPDGYKAWHVRGVIGGTLVGGKRMGGKEIFPALCPFWGMKMEDVLSKANVWLDLISKDIDPRSQPKEASMTVGKLWSEFYKEYVLEKLAPSTQETRESSWRLYLEKRLGEVDVQAVDSGVVSALLAEIGKSDPAENKIGSPSQANQVKACLSRMFRWGKLAHPKIITHNPCEGWGRYPQPDKERYLHDHEMAAFGKAWKALSYDCKDHKWMLMFLLLTGAREGVCIHYDPKWRTRDDALEMPPKVPGLKNARYCVMPTQARLLIGKFRNTSASSLYNVCLKIERDSKLVHFSPHDLRRTFSTFGVDLGESDFLINALINHSNGAIKDIYLKRNIKTMLPTAQRIADHMMELMGLTEADLV